MIRRLLNRIGITTYIRRYLLNRRVVTERINEEKQVICHLSNDNLEPLTYDGTMGGGRFSSGIQFY